MASGKVQRLKAHYLSGQTQNVFFAMCTSEVSETMTADLHKGRDNYLIAVETFEGCYKVRHSEGPRIVCC